MMAVKSVEMLGVGKEVGVVRGCVYDFLFAMGT